MNPRMDMAAIVRQILRAENMKQSDLASHLDVTQATVSRWLKGSEPEGDTRDQLMAFARDRGLLPEVRSANARKPAVASRFTIVPLLSWVSAGRLIEAGIPLPEDEAPKLAIADLGDGDFFALRVQGTSMDRISPDKSVIVVNRAQRNLQDGKPYVFVVRGEATFKLWKAHPPRLEPYSTDPSNEPVYIDRRQKVDIVGRVRRSILDL